MLVFTEEIRFHAKELVHNSYYAVVLMAHTLMCISKRMVYMARGDNLNVDFNHVEITGRNK